MTTPQDYEKLVERRDSLFAAIAHGDQDHRDWLREAIAAHFAGQTVPEPRGKGTKEAALEASQARAKKLEEALGFYARENNWRSMSMHMCGHPGETAASIDAGRRARTTLGIEE